MDSLTQIYPLPIIISDYLLGMIMWTLLARSVLDLFVAPNSEMVLAKVFRQITDPIIRIFRKITPFFLAPILIPVYVAWWFYLVRFYVVPYLFFGEVGMLSFPLESTISKFILGVL